MWADANILRLVNVAKIIICGDNGTTQLHSQIHIEKKPDHRATHAQVCERQPYGENINTSYDLSAVSVPSSTV